MGFFLCEILPLTKYKIILNENKQEWKSAQLLHVIQLMHYMRICIFFLWMVVSILVLVNILVEIRMHKT